MVSRSGIISWCDSVERRPDQIVHGGVDHYEFLGAVPLAIEHARQQHAGGADDGTARFHHRCKAGGAHGARQAADELANLGALRPLW